MVYKIVIQGTRKLAYYIKMYLKIPNKISFFAKQNQSYIMKLKKADILVSMSWGKSMWGGVDKVNIPITENLKLIHAPGTGLDGINFKNIPLGCKVCNVYEHEIPIAEYCLASILNWEIQLSKKINNFKKLDWKDSIIFDGPSHSELYGKTVGILGYGKIGKEIAKRLNVFVVETIAYTRVKQ